MRISFEQFEKYAQKLLKNGTNICPCCLSKHIHFTTDDDHTEYWLECAVCHIGVRSSQFSSTHRTWEYRPHNISKLHERTHNITCEYYDDIHNENQYVTTDKN